MGKALRFVVVALAVTVTGTGLKAGQRGVGPDAIGQKAGIIVGRVVDAATGASVVGSVVAIRTGAPPVAGGNPFSAGAGNLQLLTGPDGRFVVRDVPMGSVNLRVSAPGYLSGAYGQARPGGDSRPVLIRAENPIVNVTVRLWKPAAVSGVITDDGHEPAVNVTVRAMRRTFASGMPRYVASGTGRTDDRGVYRISGLTPGDYVVVVPQTHTTVPVSSMNTVINSLADGQGLSAGLMEMAAASVMPTGGASLQVGDQLVSATSGALPVVNGDGRMAAYLTQYYPAAATPDRARVISLASGEQRNGVDIRMPLVATAGISGTVVGPDGPIANVQVRVVPVGDSGEYGNLTDVARGATAVNGTFQLFGVPVGQYVLRVLRVSRRPLPAGLAGNPQLQALLGGRGGDPALPSDGLTLFADVPVSVEQDITDLVVSLRAGATVSGRISFAGTAARAPTTGLTVTLTPLDAPPGRVTRTRVGEDGRFTTAGHPPGRYLLNATGRPPWLLKSAMINGIDALEQPFELSTEDIGNVVVTFTDRQTRLSGTVTAANGAPAEVTVLVFPADHRNWIAHGMVARLMRRSLTSPTGGFSVNGLPARNYLVVALANDDVPDPQDPGVYEALARVATPITLSEDVPRTVSLKLTQVGR